MATSKAQPDIASLNLADIPVAARSPGATPQTLTNVGNAGTLLNPTFGTTQSGLNAVTGGALGMLLGNILANKSSTGTGTTGGTGGTAANPATTAANAAKQAIANQAAKSILPNVSSSGGTLGSYSASQSTQPGTSITSNPTYFTDSSGNIYQQNSDGSYTLLYTALGNTNYQSAITGDVFDQSGNMVYYGSDYYSGNTGSLPSAPTDYNYTTDSSGNVYDSSGNLIAYGSSAYQTGNTGGASAYGGWDPGTTYDTGGGWDPNAYKDGGLATPLMKDGGKVQHMATGGTFIDQVAASAPSASLGATPAASSSTDTSSNTGTGNFLSSPLGTITNILGQSPGLSGTLIGALLGQLLSGSSTGSTNQGVNMAQLSQIQPRTTGFGIGPTKFTPYSMYGTPPLATGAYNNLYSNLGVTGYLPQTNPLLAPRVRSASAPYYSFGKPVDPTSYLKDGGQAHGGLSRIENTNIPLEDGTSNSNVPDLGERKDFRAGSYVEGPGDGQSDDIPAMLADGEYVIDAETVSQLGNGSNKAGAKVLDQFRQNIRSHKRNTPLDKIPPKSKSPLAYLKGAK